MTAADEIRRLEGIGHATWPALEEEHLHGWLLRAAGGATRRANSASPVTVSGVGLDRQIAAIEAWYRDRGLPPIFRLTEASDREVDTRLVEHGYARDPGAVIMTCDVRSDATAEAVTIAPDPSEAWLEVMAREEGRGGEFQEVLRSMFGRIAGPAGFASISRDGRLSSIGLGVLAGDQLALYMMQTVPEQRRRGLGTTISEALASWGYERGARHLFLQVHLANKAAIAFYRRLGFEPQYEYWYRQRPE